MCYVRIDTLGVNKFKPCAHKTDSWYVLGVLSKISEEQPPPFFIGVFPWGRGGEALDILLIH